LDIFNLGNFLLPVIIIPAFFILAQGQKILFSGVRFHPDDLYPVFNSGKRYMLSFLANIYRLYESFLVLRTLILQLFICWTLVFAFEVSRIYGVNVWLAEIPAVLLFSAFASLSSVEITNGKFRRGFFKAITFPVYWLNIVLTPLTEIINEIIFLADRKFLKNRMEQDISKAGDYFWGESVSDETPNKEEIELIDGIVSFKEISAKEVMTPRTDMITVSDETGFEELLNIINSSRHSRIPLYSNDLDNIIGIIYVKDLLPLVNNNSDEKKYSPSSCARKALFVPETKMIKDLLWEFQQKKTHIAIVIDEFGGTAGLITMEDIIEEIVGEIRDELDIEENTVVKIDSGKYIVLGKISVEELNEHLELDIPITEGYDSIAGFVLSNAGEFPKEGFSFKFNDVTLTVKEIINKRIKKVLIEKPVTNN